MISNETEKVINNLSFCKVCEKQFENIIDLYFHLSNYHEKSAEEEKFEADIRNYSVHCKLCRENFPGDSEYENHKCSQKFKINPFENFKEKMEEDKKDQPFPGIMEIPVMKNFEIVYARLLRLEAFADIYSLKLKDSIDKLNRELVENCDDIHKLTIRIEAVRSLFNKRHFSNLNDTYQPIPSNLNPHKCPVCQGSGGVKHPLTGLLAPAACRACEGKGIVWG